VIQWENGLGGSGGYERIFLGCVCLESVKKSKNPLRTDFSWVRVLGIRKKIQKSVGIRPIRPIRSPIVSQHSEIRNPPSEIRLSV
jgi:hypothetical protein